MPGFIPFKELAENIDIEQVAQHLGLPLKRGKDLRSPCPACLRGDERALQIIPETNSFRCYAAELSGDCISLYGHIRGLGMYKAAKELQELFTVSATAGAAPTTTPQKPAATTTPLPPAAASTAAPLASKSASGVFDPDKFAGKLQFTDEVAVLGFTEEEAERFEIGFYRGQVFFPIRDANGSIAGFVGYKDGELKLPPKWLPPSNVVRLKTA